MILAGKTEVVGEEPRLSAICSPQISYGLTWAAIETDRRGKKVSCDESITGEYIYIVRASQRTQCAAIGEISAVKAYNSYAVRERYEHQMPLNLGCMHQPISAF